MLKNFCHIKEINAEKIEDAKEKEKAKEIMDYVIGKYLKLIYICLFQISSPPELLSSCQKYAFFYSVSKLESHQLEALPLETLEAMV